MEWITCFWLCPCNLVCFCVMCKNYKGMSSSFYKTDTCMCFYVHVHVYWWSSDSFLIKCLFCWHHSMKSLPALSLLRSSSVHSTQIWFCHKAEVLWMYLEVLLNFASSKMLDECVKVVQVECYWKMCSQCSTLQSSSSSSRVKVRESTFFCLHLPFFL